MTTKVVQIQELFKQLKNLSDEQMNSQQKKYFQKLNSIYKDIIKNQKVIIFQEQELGIQGSTTFLTSFQIQLYTLKKDVLNNKKSHMSDYEVFLWKYQYYKNHKDLFMFIEKKQLMKNITLPIRAISYTQQKPKIDMLKNLCFCPLGHSINNIINFSIQIFNQNFYYQKNLNKDIMSKLIGQISKQYQIVSYHNFTHAFSVQLMLFQSLQKSEKLKSFISPFQTFISYVAALAHDIGHYGTNSQFQVKRKSQIAKLYCNQSVLENMHLAKFYKMLRKNPQIDIMSMIKDPVQKQRSKRLLIRLILGTDVSRHFQNLSRFKALQSRDLWTLQLLQKQIIYENLFHACDIGNCCLEFGDFMNWALLLSYQFNSQYQMESNYGLQKTSMFKYGGQHEFYKGQCGFIDFLAYPLWKTIGQTFNQLSQLIQKIQKNRKQLQQKVQITA